MSNQTVYIVAFLEYVDDYDQDRALVREKKAYPELMQATQAAHAWAAQNANNDFDIDIVEYA